MRTSAILLLFLSLTLSLSAQDEPEINVAGIRFLDYGSQLPEDLLATKSVVLLQLPPASKSTSIRGDWEPMAKEQPRIEAKNFLNEHPGYIADDCPEARGVNLAAMIEKQKEIVLDWTWPPKQDSKTYVISLAGFKR